MGHFPNQAAISAQPSRNQPIMPSDNSTFSPLLLTRPQAAQVLAISIDMVDVLVRRGELHPIHIGRSVRFEPTDLAAFVASRRQARPAEAVTR
jgi:excisionase family DNA binding protein